MAAAIERLATIDDASAQGLAALLIDAVDGGASVGFPAPLENTAAHGYWQGVAATLGADNSLWIARDALARIAGSVQLQRAGRQNGRHRGEVCKLLVRRDARRAGVATQLMDTLQAHAREIGLTLLVLDTQVHSPAEAFYRGQGWLRAGEIPDYVSDGQGAMLGTALYYKPLG